MRQTIMHIITADTSPLNAFLYLLEKAVPSLPDTLEFPKELVRLDQDASPAGADKTVVTFYPSNSLLRYTAALLADDPDFKVFQETGHKGAL